MARPHLQLGEGRWRIWRLADDEFVSLGRHALPLRQDFDLLLRLQRRTLPDRSPMTLAHALTALELRFGPSSPLFDAQHGSFSFPLLLTTECGRRVSLLLRCHDHRNVLYFPLYCILDGDPSEHERAQCHEPDCADLSRSAIDEFVMLFHSYLLEQATRRETRLVAAFYRAVPSDFTLYGHDGVTFFERRYGGWAQFESARQALDGQLGPRHTRTTSNRVERFIDEITQVETATCRRAFFMSERRGK